LFFLKNPFLKRFLETFEIASAAFGSLAMTDVLPTFGIAFGPFQASQ
jgi:hypothetical protein